MLQSIILAANLTSFLLCGLLLILSLMSGSLRRRVFRWYFALVLIVFIGAPCDMLVMALSGTPGRSVFLLIRIVDGISFGSMGFAIFAAALYFYEFLSSRAPVSKGFLWFQGVLALLVTLLVAIAQFTPILARLDASNHYLKGPLFWVYEIFPLLALLACMMLTLQHIQHLERREWMSLLSYTLLPLACHLMELWFPSWWLSYLGSTFALFLMYMNIQVEQKHRLLEKEAELAEGRIAMTLSQIQPHFLFNTLTSISEVCQDNPLAQNALMAFSGYLRMNMDALTQKAPVPFEKELEHVQQYLWLEQLRFEEKLTIAYDVQATDFLLPVLTLQPIVENAVKHGITRKASPGTVWIRTERTSQGVALVVTDDGVGFDPAAPPEDSRSHTGLENVSIRLREISGGRLMVESTPGQGTQVTIFLPEQGGA